MLSGISSHLQKFANSGLAAFILYFVIFWIAAAASHAGFFAKWGLRNNETRFGIEKMLDGTAHRPFVYRQLSPLIANFLDRNTPASWKAKFEKHTARVSRHNRPEYRFRYGVIYYLSFISLLISLFLLRRILVGWGVSEGVSLVAPVAFVLAMPYLQTRGGYFYDSVELLFLSGGFLLASQGRGAALVVLTTAATINKESYFFFLLTLYPILRQASSPRKAAIWIGAATCVSLAVGLVIKFLFRENPGGVVEFWLLQNLNTLSRLGTYFQSELTYGLVGPAGLFLGSVLFFAIVVVRGWPACSSAIKQHIVIGTVVTLPLILLFTFPGELRNLSILSVGFILLLAFALELRRTSPRETFDAADPSAAPRLDGVPSQGH